MELYKYCDFNLRSQSVMLTQNVWYSSRFTLNDPYDCLPEVEFDLQVSQLKEYPNFPKFNMKNISKNQIENMCKTTFIELFLDAIGIYCLSKDPCDELMWAHYANDHRGILIGWDVGDGVANSVSKNHMNARDVRYVGRGTVKISEWLKCYELLTDERRASKANSNSQGEILLSNLIDACYLRKNPPWCYEKEVRFVNQNGHGLARFHASISSITYGCRFDDSMKSQVKMVLPVDVEEYKIMLGTGGLERVKV